MESVKKTGEMESCSRTSKVLTPASSDVILAAAIDFGTTFSGYAISFGHDFETIPTTVHYKSCFRNRGTFQSANTPTTVLIKPDGKTLEAFGYEAEDRFADLASKGEDKDYYFFLLRLMMLRDYEAGIKSSNLLIALEPEAASVNCKHLCLQGQKDTTKHVAYMSAFETGSRYILADAGGPGRTFGNSTSEYRDQLLKENKETKPNLGESKNGRFLFLGPIRAGKSSFINSVASIDRGRITNQLLVGSAAESLTTKCSSQLPKNEFSHFKLIHEIWEEIPRDEELIANALNFLLQGKLLPDYKFDHKPPVDIFDERNFKNDLTLIDRCHCIVSDSSLVIDTVSTLDKEIKDIKLSQQYLQIHEKSLSEENSNKNETITLVIDTSDTLQDEQSLRKDCQETERKIEDVLEKETPRLEHLVMCKICLDVDASVVFLPCTHMVACGLCAGYLQRCPLCRAMIDKVLYINLQ